MKEKHPDEGYWKRLFSDDLRLFSDLEKFFRERHDYELGRWRSKEHPDYVVYPSDQFAAGEPNAWVRVVHERTSFVEEFSRGATGRATRADMNFVDVAEAFFAAHPEPKPWHDAKPGEAWVLTIRGLESVFVLDDENVFSGTVASEDHRFTGLTRFDDKITAGRRIWPEVSGE